jgi:ribonuclease PH
MISREAWLTAMSLFYTRHRNWLESEAEARIDQRLIERLIEPTVNLTFDGDEGIGVSLRWFEADGIHEQRLAHFGAFELIDANARHFGGDCDMGSI